MSGKEVLSNLAYFLETILPEAYTSHNWKKESVKEAFKWACYCEKIYKDVESHPKAEELDGFVRTMGVAIDQEQCDVCLKHLKFSSKILLQAYLQNDQLEYTIRQTILDCGKTYGLDIPQSIDEDTAMRSVCNTVINSGNLSIHSRRKYMSVIDEIEAELLLEFIKRRILSHKTEKEIEEELISFLEESCKKQQLKTILDVLLLNTDDDTIESVIQKILLNHVCERINTEKDSFDESFASLMWKQPLNVLRFLATKELIFYKRYVDVLVKSTAVMEYKIVDDVAAWVPSESSLGHCFTFDQIVLHFRNLCNWKDKMGKRTYSLLQSFLEETNERNIWKDILDAVSRTEVSHTTNFWKNL